MTPLGRTRVKPLTIGKYIAGVKVRAGVKGHSGVIWGQPKVKLHRNALALPNLIGKTSDQSEMHCWSQRPCTSQPGSTRCQID